MLRLPPRRAVLLAALALLGSSASSAHADAGASGAGATIGPTAPVVTPTPEPISHAVVDDASSPSGWRLESTTPQPRIIGGTGITPSQAPWSVFLFSQNPATNYETTCGGAILNATTIVTAAHCLTGVTIGAPPSNLGLGIVAGLTDYNHIDGTSQSRTASAARIHPQWKGDINTSSGGDVAVLSFSPALDLSGPNVKAIAFPAPIASVNGDPLVPPTLSVLEAGYGDQDVGGHADGTIHALNASIVDSDICAAFAVSAPTLCAQSPAGTPCHGDSGSALVAQGPTPMILGVVSGGAAGACASGNGVAYTSLIAPENRVFVDGGTPVIAPRQTDFTRWKTNSAFRTGTTLTCFGDNWSNGATVKWVVTNETGALVASGFGAAFSYTFAATDVGHTLSCRSYGSNAGGVGVSDRVALPQAIAAGPATSTGTGTSTATGTASTSPQVADGNGMHVVGPKAVSRGHTGKFKVTFDDVPTGSTRIRVTVTVKGSHGTSTSQTYRIPLGSTAGSVTMKLKLSKKISKGTKTVSVTATTYFGTKKNAAPRKLTVKLKVK